MKINVHKYYRETTHSRIWRIVMGLVLLTRCILSGEGVCRADAPNADPNDAYVSIPLTLCGGDNNKVLTEAFLKCRVRRYSLSVSEFLKTANDPEEKALSRLFSFIQDENIQDGNLEQVPNDLLPPDAGQKPRKTAFQVRKMMGALLPNSTVKAMVHVGENRVFIIEVADPRFARPAGLAAGRIKFVMKRTDAGWRWDGFVKKERIFSVIAISFIYEMSTDGIFSKCREDLRFNYVLPSTTKGSPVYFQFNGRKVDVDIFADNLSVPTNDPVMQFYVNTWQAFKKGPIELFLQHWDQKSRTKMTPFLGEMTDEKKANFRDQIVSEGRRAWFVLEAAPLSIVFFYSPARRTERFDHVRERPEGAGFQLCVYKSRGFGEQFLASKEIGQILKEAAGTMLE